MEHTNYEIQVYLLLLLIFIIQTYIQARAQTFWGAGAQTKKMGTHRQNY